MLDIRFLRDDELVGHPLFALWSGHLFDGVAEGGAGHLVGMLAEKAGSGDGSLIRSETMQ